MALTESSDTLALGTIAPDFRLVDVVSEKYFSTDELRGNSATVLLFICNHCPYVKHINKELVLAANDYAMNGVQFIAISSNDAIEYPEDSPENMKRVAFEEQYPFPYLYDETQETAHRYGATCTPDIFIFDKLMYLVYHGQFDSSRPSNTLPVTGKDIRMALDALLIHQEIPTKQIHSIGCSIKWKKRA